jgi:phosphatidylserine synthase
MILARLKLKAGWWCLYSAIICLFLALMLVLSLRVTGVSFVPDQIAFTWVLLFTAAVTIFLALFAIPRWQSLVAIAISILAILWWLSMTTPKPILESASQAINTLKSVNL